MVVLERKIEFQQVLKKDGSVHSHQWTALTTTYSPALTVEEVVNRYLAFLRSCTLGFVRPLRNADGIALRLLGLPLICLDLPVVTCDGSATSADLFINGGLLVQRDSCNRGQLRFTIVNAPGQIRFEIRLSDFFPLLLGTHAPTRFRKWLYRITQASIHNMVTVRFLARLSSDLTGTRPPLNVVRIPLVGGEDI